MKMKTKQLAVMAMPLLLAACSQEEFLSENSNPALNGRKVVENVTFNFNVPTTRMHFEGGYQWDNGDKFGACLMDEFVNAESDNWFDYFILRDYIQSNYPFTRQDNNVWANSEAVMQEGNYFFYYPYNDNLGGKRTPIRINVPTTQVVEDGASMSSVLDYQLFAAYAEIVADPEKGDHESVRNLTMEPLLSFPAFNIKNNTGNPFTIYRIAVAGKDGNDVDIAFPTILEVKPATGEFRNRVFKGLKEDEKRKEILKIVSKNDEDVISKVSLVYGENGKTLNNSEEFTSYVMLPALNLLDTNGDGELLTEDKTEGLKLHIYTDKGLVSVNLSSEDANDSDNDDIKVQNSLISYEYNDGHITYITLDEKAFATPNSMDIASTRDLEDLVTWNTNTQGNITANIINDVILTKTIYDVLNKEGSKLELTLTGNAKVTIPEDAPENAIDRIKFNDPNLEIINEANVVISKDFGQYKKITNEGVMTWTAGTYTLTDKTFVNNGNLTFNKKDMAIYLGTFENYGEIIVKANVIVMNGELKNSGIVTINEGIKYNGGLSNKAEWKNGKVVAGTMNVNGTFIGFGSNSATIVVGEKGQIVSDGFTNNENYLYNNNYEVIYSAVILNNGVISGIINNGSIRMVSANARLQSDDTSTGSINNNECSPYVKKTTNETIYVAVTENKKASEIATLVKKSNAKQLQLQGVVTIDPTKLTEPVVIKGENEKLDVVVTGNLNFEGQEGAILSFENANNLSVQRGTMLVKNGIKVDFGQAGVSVASKLIVEAGAEFACGVEQVKNAEVYGTWTKNEE